MTKKTLDIVIPVYNEEEVLEHSVAMLWGFCLAMMEAYRWRIVIADNGSFDQTRQISQQLVRKYQGIEYTRLEEKGRGRAVKKVWTEGESHFCAYMDVDLSTQLRYFPNLIKALDGGYEIAIGSRLLPGSTVYGRTLKRELISRSYNLLIKLVFRTKFSDAQCGFKAVTRRVVEELVPDVQDNGWFFDSELLILGEKKGYKIYEEPVTWIDDPSSTVKIIKTARGDLEGLWRVYKKLKVQNLKVKS